MKSYWIGSNVPYEEWLRRRDIAREGAKPVVEAISTQTKAIVGELKAVNRNLEQINQTLQWGFAATIAQLRIMNETLAELLKVAKNPAQTAAYEQFEIARDAFRRELYLEALAAITAAIDGNNASPGYKLEWRFHFFLGCVRLGNFDNNSPEVVDLSKAEAAFLEAARIAKADAPDEAARALTAAGWAALVASSGSGESLERALSHTMNARAAWERIPDSGAVELGRADTYLQLAKVAAVRDDDALLCEAYETAIVLDYDKLSAAVEDGDLAQRVGTDMAVTAAVERQLAWLKAETQRRLEVAKKAGLHESTAGQEPFVLPQRLLATTSAADAVRYVACGLMPTPSELFNALWENIVGNTCTTTFYSTHSGTYETLTWRCIEQLSASSSSRLSGGGQGTKPYIEFRGRAPVRGSKTTLWHFCYHSEGHRLIHYDVQFQGEAVIFSETMYTWLKAWVGGEPVPLTSAIPEYGGKSWAAILKSAHPDTRTITVFDCYHRIDAAGRIEEHERAIRPVCDSSVFVVRVENQDSGDTFDNVNIRTGTIETKPFRRGVAELVSLSDPKYDKDKKCFPASAIVTTPKGRQRIADLVPGDIVLGAYGFPRRVLEQQVHGTARVTEVVFHSGEALRATDNHLVFTEHGWRSVGSLVPGQVVHGQDGARRRVASRRVVSFAAVYNLIVEGGEYVVDGVVVHSFATLRVPRTVLWSVAPRVAPRIEAAVIAAAERLESWRDRAVRAFHRLVSSRTARLLS